MKYSLKWIRDGTWYIISQIFNFKTLKTSPWLLRYIPPVEGFVLQNAIMQDLHLPLPFFPCLSLKDKIYVVKQFPSYHEAAKMAFAEWYANLIDEWYAKVNKDNYNYSMLLSEGDKGGR